MMAAVWTKNNECVKSSILQILRKNMRTPIQLVLPLHTFAVRVLVTSCTVQYSTSSQLVPYRRILDEASLSTNWTRNFLLRGSQMCCRHHRCYIQYGSLVLDWVSKVDTWKRPLQFNLIYPVAVYLFEINCNEFMVWLSGGSSNNKGLTVTPKKVVLVNH